MLPELTEPKDLDDEELEDDILPDPEDEDLTDGVLTDLEDEDLTDGVLTDLYDLGLTALSDRMLRFAGPAPLA